MARLRPLSSSFAALLAFLGRSWRSSLLRLAIGLGSLGLVLWRLDVPGALGRLDDVDLRWVAPGLLAFTASKLVHTFRWSRLLEGREELTTWRLAPVFLLSNMVNALVPLRVGDLLRVELPSRRYGVPRAELVSSVFVVESVFDGAAFVLLFMGALLSLDLPDAARPAVIAAGSVAIAAFLAAIAVARMDVDRRLASTRGAGRLPRRIREPLARWLPEFAQGMRSLQGNRALLRTLALSLVAWLAEVPLYWMMARAFGLDPGFSEALVLMIAANLIVSIPITPWDIGPYEVAVTEAYVLLGADRLEASAFAIGSHLLLQLWVAMTGVAAMWWLDLRPRDLLRRGGAPHPSADSS